MLNNNASKQKMSFLNKYGYFIAVAVGAIALITMVIISSLNQSSDPPPATDAQIVFAMPVMDATIYKNFDKNFLQYNPSMNYWEAHKAVSFLVSSNLNVCAAYDGIIKEVYTNFLDGTVVVIDHGQGLETSYGSLDKESLEVKVGDTVKKGEKIGSASDSANKETNLGAYLYFTAYENGEKIDPSGYLSMELK